MRIRGKHLPNMSKFVNESAFAVKWAISRQIAGQPELSFDPAKGMVRSAWLAWRPYLWADGVTGRKDGLKYIRSDLGTDGTHPSTSGRVCLSTANGTAAARQNPA